MWHSFNTNINIFPFFFILSLNVLTNNNSKNSRLADIFMIFPLVFCIIVVRLTWLKKKE